MQYILSEEHANLIEAKMPTGHSFSYKQGSLFLHDAFIVTYYPFDINITLFEAIGAASYDAYIATLTTLDSLYCKIYDYVPADRLRGFNILEAPVNLDYKTGLDIRLHAKNTLIKGELVKTEYFSDQGLTDKVLDVAMIYNRDAIGFVLNRTVVRRWVMKNGEYHPTVKTTFKDYTINPQDQISEGVTRRENSINALQPKVLYFMLTTIQGQTQTQIVLAARAFMDNLEDPITKFIKNSSTITDPASPDLGKKKLWVAFRDAPEAWLDNTPAALGGATIRQYMMNEVSI